MPLPSGWYKVEQLGHRTSYALCEEVSILGTTMLKISLPALPDSPEEGRGGTPESVAYISGASLYQLTPVDEEAAMQWLRRQRPHVPRALPAPDADTGTDSSDDTDTDSDDDTINY